MHCPGFRHQIAAAPAANQIAPLSLIRFKYSTLTHQIPSPDGVVVRTPGYNAEGRGIESCWTRSLALESYPNEQLHVGPNWGLSGPTCGAHVGYPHGAHLILSAG